MADAEIRKSQILIVDDEREHAQVMCEALQRIGHRCDVTFNVDEARQRLERKAYDVGVTDLVREGKRDGLQVRELAKKKTPPPPVVLVTAHGTIKTYKEAKALGAYDFIEK